MLLVIILVFTLCWAPRFLLNITKWMASGNKSSLFNVGHYFFYLCHIAKMLPFIHAMMNPIIYR